MTQDIRWIQRFDNFKRAFCLLREVMEENADICTLTPIIKEGIVQRFEYNFELAWKTLKDKMIEDGLLIDRLSPKYVFKLAYQSKYINHIDSWIAMVNDRNLMSHTDDFTNFDLVLQRLQQEYFPLLEKLYLYFLEEQTK